MKQVDITVWSDFVCPWCWIAKRRLERAIQSLDQDIQVKFEFKSYRLGRGTKPIDYRQAIEQKIGDPAAADYLIQEVTRQSKEEGLVYNFDNMLFGDTSLAHAFVKSVKGSSEQNQLIELISKESISKGRNIFDRDVLLQLATEVGIPHEALRLDDIDTLKEITQDELEANKVSHGVPLFLFNQKTLLSGAQPFEVFVQTLLQTAMDIPDISEKSVAVCSINGCEI